MAVSYTTTYNLTKPEVGASEDAWGGLLNTNFDNIDNLLDGTTAITGIDINSGSIDGTVIGANSAAAITGTTITASTSITGTLATAAQPNITSVGSLTSLDVGGTVTADGLIIDTNGGANSAAFTRSGSLNEALTIEIDDAGPIFTSVQDESDNGKFVFVTGSNSSDSINSAFVVEKPDGSNIFRANSNNDISFYEDTGTTAKFFWDASAESLGIGTSSPNSGRKLHVFDSGDAILRVETTTASGDGRLELVGDSAGVSQIRFGDEVAVNVGLLTYTHSENSMAFNTNGSERMRITSSGSLGIGTASPASIVGGTDTSPVLSIGGTDSGLTTGDKAGSISFITNDGSYTGTYSDGVTAEIASVAQTATGAAYALAFYTSTITGSNRGERMRIDASGNVIVGGTTANSLSAVTMGQTGYIWAGAYNSEPLILDRGTSDGGIVAFKKDGTTVGSIGSLNGVAGAYFGTGSTAISAYSGALRSVNGSTGSYVDNTINIGTASSRFKDLYLSGGVYLGGTGSANKLDDYEEGTFTAQMFDAATGGNASSTTTTGYYTKVGRLVTVSFSISNIDTSGMTGGNLAYFALPFANNSTTIVGSVRLFANVANDSVSLASQVTSSNSRASIIESRDDQALQGTAVSDFTSGASDMSMTITYHTAT